MITTGFRRALVAAVASLSFVACGGDPTGTADLTTAEIEDMMDAMSAIGAFGGAGFVTKHNGATTALTTYPLDSSTPCPGGGTFTQDGLMTVNDATGASTVVVTTNYNSCKATAPSSGRVWTFDGNPNIHMNWSMSAVSQSGSFTMNGTQNGGLKFSSSAGSGTCEMTVTYSYSVTSSNATGSLTGTVCGKSISQSF